MNQKVSRRPISRYRWVVLATFMIIALLSQLSWLTFAPISSEVAKLFDVNAFDVSLLSLVWPLIFVILAIPVGIFIDRKGFKTSVLVGALFLAFFSALRIFSTVPNYNFILLLLSQCGAAVSQPFIFGSITKLAVSWFPEKEQGLATGLGSIGLFLGMMLALAVTPALFLEFGATGMLIIYSIISCAGATIFLIFSREGQPADSEKTSSTFTLHDLWTLSKLKGFIILEYGFFAVVGGFTAITTWLEEILRSLHGISIDQAGIAGGLLIIGGIIGSIVIPALSDKVKKIKPFILLDLAIGTLALYLIATEITNSFLILSLVCFIAGFFLMSALPLVLELSSRIAKYEMAGRASSLLWFFSQVGSVLLIALIDPIKSLWGSHYYSLVVIALLWVTVLLLFMGIKEVKTSSPRHGTGP